MLTVLHMPCTICSNWTKYLSMTCFTLNHYFNTLQRYLNVESVVVIVGFNKQYSYKTVIKLHTITQHKITVEGRKCFI